MRHFPAEFEKQSFIQVIFPHALSDWNEYLQEAEENFINIINVITTYQDCLVVCHDLDYVKQRLKLNNNLHLVQAPTNDTWARDCSALCVYEDDEALLLDFTFTAWGEKFESNLDNALSENISNAYNSPMKKVDYILEGGAVESNGKGVLLTTNECIFNHNRNALPKERTLDILKQELGSSKILVLKHGFLEGDDTDSHIDTLARFVSVDTIVYLECLDEKDIHFKALAKMKEELKVFTDQEGKPFNLIALPFTRAHFDEEERLPTTYANFLILNEAVLVPTYKDENDEKALEIFKKLFPTKDIIDIDCSTLIRQHGSLHCVTMQFPSKVKLNF